MYLAKIVYNVANFTRPSCISGHENSKLCDKNVSFPKKREGGGSMENKADCAN